MLTHTQVGRYLRAGYLPALKEQTRIDYLIRRHANVPPPCKARCVYKLRQVRELRLRFFWASKAAGP